MPSSRRQSSAAASRWAASHSRTLKYRSGAGEQEIDGLALDGPLLRDGEWWNSKYGLAGDSQRLSARGKHLEMRAGPQQRVDEKGTAVQHVLAVVEEE